MAGVGRDPARAGTVSLLLRLAEARGIEVIAVGVAEDEDAHALRELGVRAGQGRWFGEPLMVNGGSRA